MKKIDIFLASSNELKFEREQFGKEIESKNKLWSDKNVRINLDAWEDLTARMSLTRSQDEYNSIIKKADIFILLAYSKVGMYTKEEFEAAFGAFQETQKPFIFTYFKDIEGATESSLIDFKTRLKKLGHFYSSYSSFEDLWIQFNKEIDRLLLVDFKINLKEAPQETNIDNSNSTIQNQFIGGNFDNPTFN